MVKISKQSRSLGQRVGLSGKRLTEVLGRVKFSISIEFGFQEYIHFSKFKRYTRKNCSFQCMYTGCKKKNL